MPALFTFLCAAVSFFVLGSSFFPFWLFRCCYFVCVRFVVVVVCVGRVGGGEGGRNSFWVHKQKETKKEEVYLTLTRYTL